MHEPEIQQLLGVMQNINAIYDLLNTCFGVGRAGSHRWRIRLCDYGQSGLVNIKKVAEIP